MENEIIECAVEERDAGFTTIEWASLAVVLIGLVGAVSVALTGSIANALTAITQYLP